jgi:hypothetical protein
MDPNRLSTGEKVLGGSALLLLILSFLGFWAKVEVSAAGSGVTQKFNAWDGYGFLVKVALLLSLVAIGLVIAKAADAKLSIPWGTTYLGVGGGALIFMLLALVVGPDESGSGNVFGVKVEISRGIGLFLGTLLAAAMAFGAWMHYSEGTGTSTAPAAPEAPPPAV